MWMDDAVGEVLAQRKALDRGAGAGVALSLLLHGAITAAAVWGALRVPSQESLPVIDIQFAKMPAPPAPAPDSGLKPAAPQPKPQPVVETPKPVDKPAPAKSVPLSPFGKSTKKGAEHPAAPQPRNPATTTPDIPVGGTGAVVEGDFPHTLYVDRIRTLIGQHWYRPQTGPGTATTVSFVIERDGNIRDVVAEAESGNTAFDLAARRAVLEASPLPPLPYSYSGTFLRVHLTFK
jgi:periplasmic protein TonB